MQAMEGLQSWILLVLLVPCVDLIRLKNWENEVLEQALYSTKEPRKARPEKTPITIANTPSYATTPRPANKSNNSTVPLRSARLLGPLHVGQEWMLTNNDVPHFRPITGSNSIEGTFLWAVGLFGTVENGALVITVLSSKRCRRPLHILVGALGITDMFISTIYIPSYTYFLLEGVPDIPQKKSNTSADSKAREIKFEWNFCVVSRSFFIEIASVTLTIKALIAGYLYIYTISKQTAEKLFTIRNTITIIVGAWILNFIILFVPIFIGIEQVDFYPNAMLCQKNWQTNPPEPLNEMELPAFVYMLVTLALHITELIMMCVCFIKVHFAIREGKNIWAKKSGEQVQDRPHAAIYSRAMKTTILLFASFALCWVPIYAANIVDPLHIRLPSCVHHIVMDLLLLKSAINPAIYIYGIRSLRRELKIMCMCRCRDPNAKNLNFKAPNSSSFESGPTGKSMDGETETA